MTEQKDGLGVFSTRGLDSKVTSLDQDAENINKRGSFIVVDGPDGIGKGEMETALRRCEEIDGKAVFDSIAYCKAWGELPVLTNFLGVPKPRYHSVMTAEPTYVGTGDNIRNEIVKRNGRNYPASVQIQAYSIDRLIQMQRVVVPALVKGLNVIQSRCLASTLTYQLILAIDEKNDHERIKSEILSHPGNIYQLENRPDLLIIATIDSAQKVMDRLKSRGANEKDDRSIFDNLKFQERLKPFYESEWLRDIFIGAGTRVAYLNAGLSIGSSRKQASEIYREFQRTGEVLELHRSPESVLANVTDRRK